MKYKKFQDHPRWVLGFVLLLALSLRLVHMLQMSSSPLFSAPAVDAGTYAAQAAKLAAGNWLGRDEGPFWQPPFYPYVLGLIKLVFADSFFYVSRVFQALVGTFSCLLVYLVGRRVFDPRVGLVAAMVAALYGPLIFFDARLLPSGLATFFTLASLWGLMVAVERRSKWIFLSAGLLLGLGAISVATLLALVPASVFWLLYRLRNQVSPEQQVGLILSLLLGVALAIAPVSLRNYLVGGDRVLISYNGGVNFYIGNNADYEQTVKLRPGWEWEELVSLPLREGIIRPGAKSGFFYAKAFSDIWPAPFKYLGLLGKKTLQFWQGDEVERNQEIYYWRKYSTVLALSLWKWGLAFPFGLVSPLALVGLWGYTRQQGLSLPVVFVLVYSLVVIAFFVTARYRLPIVPLLILFAVYGGFWLYGKWRQGAFRQWLVPLALVGFLAFALNWNLSPMDMRGKAATHNDLGNTYLRQGRHEMALFKFEQAVRLDSTYWQAWSNLGSMRAMRGDLSGALPIFVRVLEQHPERADLWSNLAGAYAGLGQYQQAIQTLERALDAVPPRVDIYAELIRLYLLRQQYDKADELYHLARWRFPADGQLEKLHSTINH